MSTTRTSRTPWVSRSRAVASSSRRRVAAPRLPSARPSSATASSPSARSPVRATRASVGVDLTVRQLRRYRGEMVATGSTPSPTKSADDSAPGLLAGVRIIECSMLGPAAITGALADLGADVIKVEPPKGDYVRRMTWPIVEGVSLMHLHINRGKHSVVLDLRTEEGQTVFCDLIAEADVVVEAMRPGGLARRGLGYERLAEVNPQLVWCTISGYGATGPYRDLASHGIAYDAWAGIFSPEIDEEGLVAMPDHVGVGIFAGPLYGAIGILAGVVHAREDADRAVERSGEDPDTDVV